MTVQRLGHTTFDNQVTVFVGNLRLDVQENQVRDLFSDCGRVVGVRLVRDNRTGAGKGFGYVSFSSREAVHLALEKDSTDLLGRPIRVRKTGDKTREKKTKEKQRGTSFSRKKEPGTKDKRKKVLKAKKMANEKRKIASLLTK